MPQSIASSEIRELKKLLDSITSGVKNVVAQCLSAGRKLTELKAKTKQGEWNDVLKSVDLSWDSAQRYMRLWEHRTDLNLHKVKTLSDAYEIIAKINTSKVSQESASLRIPTTTNEPLTSEKQVSIEQNVEAPETINGVRKSIAAKADVLRDHVGRPIPDEIVELWQRAHKMGTELRCMVSDVKCILEKGIGKDLIFAELINSAISDAKSLHYSLSQILPYAVCPTCQGKAADKCMMCRHRGFISKFYWEGPTVGSDLRAIVEKQFKTYASQTLPA